jgi:hypothetical protein
MIAIKRRCALAWLLGIAAIAGVANLEVSTRQGVNFEVSSHRMPLYLKAFEFLDRDAQYKQLAGEITDGVRSEQGRLVAIFDWMARRIQPAPLGWPVIDDHILNIIIRGYGTSDQRADVFATLLTYAGVPAFWQNVKAAATGDGVVLTFARVDGRWVVADAANGFLFRNDTGDLATAEDFAAHRVTLPAAAAALMAGSTPYSRVFTQLRTPPVPRPLRAELQMPWPRLWDEARRVAGFERVDGSQR